MQHMHSIGILTLDELMPYIVPKGTFDWNGRTLRTGSLRMRTFRIKGCSCVECGATAAFFSVECSTKFIKNTGRRVPMNNYHINLYGRRKNGSLVLMTHDHVWPLSQGGYDILKNSITMCVDCNERKADKLPSAEMIAKHGCAYDPDFFARRVGSKQPHQQLKREKTPEEIAEKEQRTQAFYESEEGKVVLAMRARRRDERIKKQQPTA